MLIGRHDSKIDEKNRISFPKKFRDELGDQLIVTQGFEGTLIVISKKQWEILVQGTEGRPITDKTARDIETFLLGSAEEVELDAKGRFVLPGHLKKFANLSESVSCLGLAKYVRIWDTKRWEEYSGGLSERIGEITEKLSPSASFDNAQDKSSGQANKE